MYGSTKNQGDMDRVYGAVQQRFEGAGDVTIHRGTSADVLATFSDGFFDWVYIDGNHDYTYVLADLLFGVKYFCRSTTTILAGSDGCSLDHARGWPDGWPRWRSGRSLGVAAGSEEAEDQTE